MKKRLLLAFITSTILCFTIIIVASNRWLKVNEVPVYYYNLPEFLNGFRILHITDLHANNPNRMSLDIWAAIESLDFDIAVITGDIIFRKPENLRPHLPGITELASRVPTFFIEGNHDWRYIRQITYMLNQAGVTTLLNENLTFRVGETATESIEIIGLRDFIGMNAEIYYRRTGLFLNESDLFRLVLVHKPHAYPAIPRANMELVLAGHTHGGQIRLPFAPTLFATGQGILPRFGDGLYDFGNSKMYISRGTGTSTLPIRFFNRPAISIIELRCK